MTGQIEDNLEKQLAALTAWSGDAPRLWWRALKAAGSRARPRRWWSWRILPWRLSGKLAAGVAVVALVATAVIVNLAQPNRGRNAARESLAAAGITALRTALRARTNELKPEDRTTWSGNLTLAGNTMRPYVGESSVPSVFPSLSSAQELLYQYAGPDPLGQNWTSVMARGNTPRQFITPSTSGSTLTPDTSQARQPSLERHVVRKATIELTTDDVRAVFLKAAMIVQEAGGEFVQDSSLTGSGDAAYANLTLRVAAGRLHEALNELRLLGEVYSESIGGQDVTGQVVDLDARLRNETRIEAELLRLLETRQEASLKEVLELRTKLGEVRQEIERLTAQGQQLSRLVSLATVLVIIRTGEGRHTSELGSYFADACRTAWTSGLVFLADTVATLLSILVGGLVWWVLLVAVVLGIRRWRRGHHIRGD